MVNRIHSLARLQREMAAHRETREQRESIGAPLTLPLRLWIHLETALMGGEAPDASREQILCALREQVLTRCDVCGAIARIGCESPTLCNEIRDKGDE
jgi:hypothetical protein